MVLVAGMSACGKGDSTPAQTIEVQIDGRTDEFNAIFNAYFPNILKVHAGDTVRFRSVFRGEPHTVTAGNLVTDGLAKFEKDLAENADARDHAVHELVQIPDMFPLTSNANQVSAQPCFIAEGEPMQGPGPNPCEPVEQPDFDEDKLFYNSGWIRDGKVFELRVSEEAEVGTYRFWCALHRSGMTGTLEVVPDSEKIPIPAEVTAAGKAALAEKVEELRAPLATAKQRTGPDVVGGVATDLIPEFSVAEFVPRDVSIPVGGAVTWTITGPHSISFNTDESMHTGFFTSSDHRVHVNPWTFFPIISEGQPTFPPIPPPAGPPPPQIVVEGGAWDGREVWSSGLMLSYPPPAYRMTFTQAGTYPYRCLLHPDMEGTVRVG